ncbi:terminase [Mycobacterium sp. KBS0706]|uniref:phage terminase large subunit family protein n=1 Tax=Mycobacterium sp. KBS0706 TaxID=2578109 RepID=UPI00110F98DC|nr:terminase gpA endonuclease subunit [Mycobacterium sp. KBS0706]TSD89079.1 terminase [Mycobacterium sp. KBS0706]
MSDVAADFRPLANLDWLFATVAQKVLEPPAPPDYSAWAHEYVRFGEESPFPGRYDPRRMPQFKRILEGLSPDHPARIVTLMGSAQIGKSVICQVFVGGSLDLDPCQVIYYHPTESNATEWVRTKWKPMIRNTPRLRELLGEERSRSGQQSILYYERQDGRGALTVAGSNSGPAVSMKSARVQIQDDLSKWEVLKAGDSETGADSRSMAFLFAKIFKVSTPLLEHNCRITRNYKAGTQEHYHVPCPHCGVMQELVWENMLAGLDEADPDDAHFTCVACDERIEERHRNQMIASGDWVANNPGAADLSFYIWAAYSPSQSWANIARAWIKAKGNPAAEMVFLNDTIGRAYKGVGESPPWEALRDRAKEFGHKLGVIPHGGLIFVAGADCQKDHVEVQFQAFGRDGRRWVVEYRVIPGHISTDACRTKLDELLLETWPDEHGGERVPHRKLQMLAIDGNAWTRDVEDWAKKHPETRVIMVRGARSETAPPLAATQTDKKPDGKPRKRQKRFYNVGVSGLKTTLYTALAKDDPQERGFVGFPQGLEDEYFQELCSERRTPKKRADGFTVYVWTKPEAQDNEALDTAIYAEAAAIRCGWRALTDKAADEIEARLAAAGAEIRNAAHPDLFEPSRPIVAAAPAPETPAPPPASPQPRPAGRGRVLRSSLAR